MSSTTTTSGSRRPCRRGFAGLAVVIVAILCALLPASAAAAKSLHRPPAPQAIKVLPLGQSRFHLSWPNVKYTPEAGFTGTDSFTFTVVDKRKLQSMPATVTVNVA